MSSSKKNKYQLTKSFAERLKAEKIKETDNFYDKHIAANNDILSIVLKTHLFIENLIDEIIEKVFVKPKEIVNSKFFFKVQIIEALGIVPTNIINKIKTLNTIRNRFAHNINYRITLKDIKPLIDGYKFKRTDTNIIKCRYGMNAIPGYLQGVKTIYKALPFFMHSIDSKKLYKKDPTFNKKVFNEHKKEVIKFLEDLKIKE